MDEAKAELPGELFCDRELPWQAIVCGHIIAALSALPHDSARGQLPALLKRALPPRRARPRGRQTSALYLRGEDEEEESQRALQRCNRPGRRLLSDRGRSARTARRQRVLPRPTAVRPYGYVRVLASGGAAVLPLPARRAGHPAYERAP
jgi:hypothetical protein